MKKMFLAVIVAAILVVPHFAFGEDGITYSGDRKSVV